MNVALAAARPVVAVAYSGGRDSTALLHATAKAAHDEGVRVLALHVHHGLQAKADEWLAHCQRQCTTWQRKGWPVELVHAHLALTPRKGESVEAMARKARYRALRDMAMAHGATVVLLAHHRRDQAETLLLQALRGAGMAGLAGMPAAAVRDGITWMRPWLKHPWEAVEAYVRRHRLRYIDDDSNNDERYARNRLRLSVWPALTAAFPQAEAALADAGTWAGEASACLGELALLDMAAVASSGGLKISALLALGAPRGRNLLRAWYREAAREPMPASWVDRLWAELPQARAAEWSLPAGTLRSYRGVLSCAPVSAAQPPGERAMWLSVKRAGRYRLDGWGGVLHVERCISGGVPLALLRELRLAERSGGEQFQSGPRRPPRSLKKQFQEAAVPAWARQGPLLFAGERLVFVPGLGVDARVLAPQGEPQVNLRWEPSASCG